MDRDLVRMSRFLARVLRHEPESIGRVLDAHGWADVDDLVRLAVVPACLQEPAVPRGRRRVL